MKKYPSKVKQNVADYLEKKSICYYPPQILLNGTKQDFYNFWFSAKEDNQIIKKIINTFDFIEVIDAYSDETNDINIYLNEKYMEKLKKIPLKSISDNMFYGVFNDTYFSLN